MYRNPFSLIPFLVILALSFVSAFAQQAVTFDARRMLIPMSPSAKDLPAVAQGLARGLMLQHNVAKTVFESQPAQLVLQNFPIPGNDGATLELVRTRAVVDANTEFYTYGKQGKVAFTPSPVVSYKGTVNGDPSTAVSLHYADGDLTGYIQRADGRKTVITRDFAFAQQQFATAHMIADEVTMFGVDPLSKFVCGSESLPFDVDAARRKMVLPSSAKGIESTQAEYLREFRLAIVLREDIDSVMKRRGQSDAQIAQYFVKVVASMAQVYEQELDASLYVGYMEKFTEDFPSGYFYDGVSPGNLLEEFSADWSGRMNSVNRTVAHLYALIRPAGGSFVGGIAFLDQLCNKRARGGYAVSTVYLNAQALPGDAARSNAFVWDVFVAAHEIGHNIGANHTHNCVWNPPVDTCQIQADRTDGCFNDANLRRARPGTIMSYCHLVNGSSTPLTFGTRPAERMRTWVAAAECAPILPQPTLHITAPRGAESFALGDNLSIRWASARVSTVNLFWSANEAGPWTPIVSNLNAAARNYQWTIPVLSSSRFWIRAEDASNPNVNDTSLASYRLDIPVVLDAPKGGERLGQGSEFTIRWTKSAGVGNVRLEFAPDGQTWEAIEESSASTAKVWTVPAVTTSNARVRVAALSAPQAPSTSADFAIGARRFALEIPEEGGKLCKNQTNQYRWNADFVPMIRIQYSTDDGGVWRSATQQTTIETSLWQIFSRNVNMNNVPSGTPLKLRVLDASSEEVLATRDLLSMDSCDAAVSVDEFSAAAPFAISSVGPNPSNSVVRVSVSSDVPTSGKLSVVATDGRVVLVQSEVSIAQGTTSFEVPVGNLSNGSYRLVLTAGGATVTAPVVVHR